MDTHNTNPQMSVSGYLPNGMRVFFTLPIALDQTDFAYEIALQFTNMLLSKGLLLTEPGLEAGEQAYTITHIARRTQPGKDGKPPTPIIDFYHDNLTFSAVKTWLNTPEQIAEFEQWSGVKLASLKSIPGSALKRDNPDADNYIIKLTIPARIIWKLNPDYTEGSKTESKRLFERFENASKNVPQATPARQNEPQAIITSTVPETGLLKDNWGLFYTQITPLLNHPRHAQNLVKLMVETNELLPGQHSVAQALELVVKHEQAKQEAS